MRNLYSDTGIMDGRFVKTYDYVVSEKDVVREFEKSRKLYLLSKKTNFFSFPKPYLNKGRRIEMEPLDYFVELRDLLLLSRFKKELPLYMYRAGVILGYIHKNLKLSEKQIITNLKLDNSKKVFLYNDFGLRSILVKNDNLFLIDPSFNLINKKVCAFGSPYHDIAYFTFSLKYLIPLKKRLLFYNFKKNKELIDCFLFGYTVETGKLISYKILKKYEEDIKERYKKTLKGITKPIWEHILGGGE